MKIRNRLAALAAMVLSSVVVLAPAAQAAYHNSYDTIGLTPNYSPCDCTGAQGFAAGVNWLYSIKTNTGVDNRAVIYRTNKDTGATSRMHNATSDAEYNAWLSHANDMMVTSIGDNTYMYIVTMNDSSGARQLVKLRYEGNNYYFVASYDITSGGAELGVEGISRLSLSSTRITFMFKWHRNFYTGSLPINAASGADIVLTKAFTIDVENAEVNGAKIAGLASWYRQGMHYDPAKDMLYVPMTSGNKSVVLLYRRVTPDGQLRNSGDTTRNPVALADDVTSFRITSSNYTKFEIESVGLSETKLYFNTNRSNSDGAYDGVHVFDDFVSP